MAVNTKNLGQVSGVAIQNTPPSNTSLIWYDNTPSQMCHKVYDVSKKQWVIIDQKIISSITYSEIVNIAQQSVLPLGKFYQITDRSNTLALSISSTKIQYADLLGNILIDDLGSNIQYHVSSSNLQIDGVSGTFNVSNNKLVFMFDELTNDIDNDYILGKTYRNNSWKLFKFKLKSLISIKSGNSITWDDGLFFSFKNHFNNLKDKIGGFVSFDTYIKSITSQNIAINNVGKENQKITQNVLNEISNATSDNTIYNKKLPSISITGEPIDIAKGDTLLSIVSKIQRYINRFKYATGIRISQDFAPNDKSENINNNDTIDSALRKIQFYVNRYMNAFSIDEVSTNIIGSSAAGSSSNSIKLGVRDNELYLSFDWLNFDYVVNESSYIYAYNFFAINEDGEAGDAIEEIKKHLDSKIIMQSKTSPQILAYGSDAYLKALGIMVENVIQWVDTPHFFKIRSSLALYNEKLGILFTPLMRYYDNEFSIAKGDTNLSDFIYPGYSGTPETYMQITISPMKYYFKL